MSDPSDTVASSTSDPLNVSPAVGASSKVDTVSISPVTLFSTTRDKSDTSSVLATVNTVGDVAVIALPVLSVRLENENTLLDCPDVRPVAVSVNALVPSIVSDVTPDSVPATTTSIPLIVYVVGNTRIVKSCTVTLPLELASPSRLVTTSDDA